MFSDADAVALYDALNPWDGNRHAMDAFYDAYVMAAKAVLDIGCGPGSMLRAARAAGHRDRLVGLDPDPAALARAAARPGGADIEWVRGVAADAGWVCEFDLATMVTHTFQLLVTDQQVRATLGAIRAALVPGGLFVFETRNPLAREWETWGDGEPAEAVDETGRLLRVDYEVETIVDDVVTFAETTIDWVPGDVLRVDRVRLRFVSEPALDTFLAEAGFTVLERYGDWDRSPVTPTSPEIITVAAQR